MPRAKKPTRAKTRTKAQPRTKARATATTKTKTKTRTVKRVTPIPKGMERVTPHLVVDGASKAIDFYKKAFDAKELGRAPAPDGNKIMHAEIKIGQSHIYLCDDFPEFGGSARNPKALGGSSVTIHQYVKNVDRVVEQAVKAGATVKMPPMDAFWGDRYGVVTDPFGHDWSFATHIKDVKPSEMAKAAEAMFSKKETI